jgi:hypothetical protein
MASDYCPFWDSFGGSHDCKADGHKIPSEIAWNLCNNSHEDCPIFKKATGK